MAFNVKLDVYKDKLVVLLLIAVLIGVVTGFLAIAFRYALLIVIKLLWQNQSEVIAAVAGMKWYIILAIPVIGGLLIGPIISFWAPETSGAGVPEVIHTVVSKDGVIRHRTTLFKILATVISIGTGASVGREGPIVHIGGSVGSSIGQLIGVSAEWRRVFLACGAAAGIAATFNAPMAGLLFAAEIILVDFQVSYLSHIAISSITATVISYHFLGTFPTFDVPHYSLVTYWEIPLYIVLGVAAGGVAIAFTRLTSKVEDTFTHFKIPVYLRPAIGGFLVGLIAIKAPHILGVGYQSVNLVLAAKMTGALMLAIIILKLLASAFSLGAGFSGGIFAPSLVMGSLLGGFFGVVANGFFPGNIGASPAYALVGMGAVVAGTTMAPITAIFTIFELTYNFEIILPLMTSCITSLIVVQTFYGHSFYETKLIRKGVRFVRGRDSHMLRSMRVGEYMDKEYESVRESTPLGELVLKVQESHYPHFIVFNDKDELAGMISLSDIKPVLADVKDLCELLVVADIMTKEICTLTPEDNFETAFKVFEGKNVSTLPVVAHRNSRKVLGVLKKSTLLYAYNEKILKTTALKT
ncbi:MAG: chloride channel protein [Thermodesulfobacteriota bacterium]|nr:MAG: chloride channel protein [Thermodesulfobacteriota bacterium]